MQTPSFAPAFSAVAVACGGVFFSMAMWHGSGFRTSAWLALFTVLIVGAGLGVCLALLTFAPVVGALLSVVGRSIVTSLILWVAVAVVVVFVAIAVTEPRRASDYGFIIPMGALYGSASGLAFWLFSGLRNV